eukprot:TRINITY_DN125903_c0_g1_i1.p1 TRINITY_DN125903_c0_g1~~TRINITY_DN125903_c0_g1_i1.p1  ORF type:complete len:162 (-),score=12.51 TRINITY_DN125903_c0_g1_i1:222-671(-)
MAPVCCLQQPMTAGQTAVSATFRPFDAMFRAVASKRDVAACNTEVVYSLLPKIGQVEPPAKRFCSHEGKALAAGLETLAFVSAWQGYSAATEDQFCARKRQRLLASATLAQAPASTRCHADSGDEDPWDGGSWSGMGDDSPWPTRDVDL